jgi:hypothetical protein
MIARGYIHLWQLHPILDHKRILWTVSGMLSLSETDPHPTAFRTSPITFFDEPEGLLYTEQGHCYLLLEPSPLRADALANHGIQDDGLIPTGCIIK